MKELIQKFNLPSYIKGKTFAEASKAIQDKFKDRNDNVSRNTMIELLSRLKQAQEYVKSSKESNEMKKGGNMYKEGGDLSSYMNLASGAFSSMNDLFGDPNIDMSGNTQYQATKPIQDIGSGILEGAQAGMAFGPVGAGAGALIKGITNLVGGNKARKDIMKAETNKAHRQQNINLNQFADGGKIKKASTLNSLDINESIFDRIPILEDAVPTTEPTELPSQGLDINLDFLKETGPDILRAAPIGANLGQLLSMDKPTKENRAKLGNRYDPQYTDEVSLINNINDSFNPEYLTEGSMGKTGAYMSNARAAQLAKTKAISDAYAQSREMNNQENRNAQNFNLDIDKFNTVTRHTEDENFARDIGAYETNKSRLLAELGNDIGEVGRELDYDNMIKDMFDYTRKGKYIGNKYKKGGYLEEAFDYMAKNYYKKKRK